MWSRRAATLLLTDSLGPRDRTRLAGQAHDCSPRNEPCFAARRPSYQVAASLRDGADRLACFDDLRENEGREPSAQWQPVGRWSQGASGAGARLVMPDDLEQPPRDFSAMTVRELREAHESAATEHVAKSLTTSGVLEVADLRRGRADEREPDAVFVCGGRPMGIELTCVGYYERGSREAGEYMRRMWNDLRELLSADGPSVLMGPPLMSFDDVRGYAQSLLDQKCGKEYRVPTILVLCAVMGHVGLTTAADGPEIARQLRAPVGCRFERIYLRMQRDMTGEIELFAVA